MTIPVPFTGNQPTYVHPDDAGADLTAAKDTCLIQGSRSLVPTGTSVHIPAGYVGLVCPRSGLAHKHGITVCNGSAVIDAGYTGEIMVNLINHGPRDHHIEHGDRIAQLLIMPVMKADFTRVEQHTATPRGTHGHGSTEDSSVTAQQPG